MPSTDPGKFNLQINGVTAGTGANVGDGGTTGAITETANTYIVGETAGTATNSADYTTAIGGDCGSDGSITLAAGDNKTCTITNTRNGGTITINKIVNNNDVGTLTVADFQMQINTGNVAQGTPIPENTGTYTIGEADSKGYIETIGGDCAANGTVTVAKGDNKVCTITNDFPFFTVTVT